jgi:methylenetetrahydrofolate reductase (NADPH)
MTALSFEFFPPRTPEGQQTLCKTAEALKALSPQFFSVTFGAGGSTREKTAETVFDIKRHTHVATAPHISCMGSTKESILELLKTYIANDVRHLVVLRGDHPSGFVGRAGEFRYANELVAFIREQTQQHFMIHVAAYPEFHPEAKNAQRDLDNFKRKVEAGADVAITQYFYNVDAYCYFRDACLRAGITVPIIPGIMPIANLDGLKRFSSICGAEIPSWLLKRLDALAEDEAAIRQFGIEVVTDLCQKLLKQEAPGLHFYTLNKAEPAIAICKHLR